jgi:hypothetical protein
MILLGGRDWFGIKSRMMNHIHQAGTMTYLDIKQDGVNQTYDLNI